MLTEDELRVKVSELVAYARDHISMNDADRIYVTNILLDFFNLTYPAPIPEKYGDFQTEIIDPIVRHAIDTGRIKPEEALLFETKVLGIVTPAPAEIISEFDAIAGNKGVQKATTWLFERSQGDRGGKIIAQDGIPRLYALPRKRGLCGQFEPPRTPNPAHHSD